MAWKPGQSGNPGGTVRERKFLEALERAVLSDNGKKLRAAAENLLNSAANGEPWAIQQLADRLDGKPTQQVDMHMRNGTPVELTDADLYRIAAASSGRTAETKSSPQKSPIVH